MRRGDLVIELAAAVPTSAVFKAVKAVLPGLKKAKGVEWALEVLTDLVLASPERIGDVFTLLGKQLLSHKESEVRAAATVALGKLATVSAADETRARAVATAKGTKAEKARLLQAINDALAAEAEAEV